MSGNRAKRRRRQRAQERRTQLQSAPTLNLRDMAWEEGLHHRPLAQEPEPEASSLDADEEAVA